MEEQAKKVSLYLECSTTAFGKKERMCGYVLEYITEKGPATLVNYREGCGTYNREFLLGLAEALERIKTPCELHIYGQNRFVLCMLRDRLADWATEDFMSKGKPIVNREEWRRIWEQIQKHQVSIELGEHAYSRWLLTEMEEKCRNYQRTKC
ncbi:RNase H family protein [Blautia argi]|uniref:RNase H family protein n=1 Tax=Blautia argi TaxID=1912897 RepID=UPI0029434455|nr:RNase H family protein [Blautia argi]